jgi:hypothetical protein
MKKIILLILLFLSLQIILTCSRSTTGLNKEDPIDILCYGLNGQFYLINESFNSIDTFLAATYPIWLDSKTKIGFHSKSNLNYYIIDAATKDTLNSFDVTGYGTCIAGRYSEAMEIFLFDVNLHGLRSIGIMDWNGNIEIINLQYPINNPVCSGIDDWIYYLKNVDGSNDVYRIKSNGSLEEQITNSQEYLYSNFSISYDGNYIVIPKFNNLEHYIAIIETETKNETLIDLSYLNLVGYTSFSKDNKYIYFTGDENRNLYRINFDGTGLKQLTDKGYLYRPLSW